MKFHYLFIITCVGFFSSAYSQDPININLLQKGGDSIVIVKPSIKKYVIINMLGDSTYVDTTLTIKKHYKFNYLKKDNLELLKYSNIGQTYNNLTHNFDDLSFLPVFSFSSKHHAYLGIQDVKYFHVPTPFTELLFKTVMKQGQFTDALFSTNTSKKLNFSIAFKGLRSLGKYQNILSGSKHFRFTTRYNSLNKKYNFKIHYVNQFLENQENGGLNPESIINFESEDPLFKERSKLSVNFEDAINYFSSKRYFLDHDFLLNNSFSIGHSFEYETLYNEYDQMKASTVYGEISPGLSKINDRTELKTTINKFYTDINSNFLGKIKVIYTNYNYDYKTNTLSNNAKGFKKNENAISAKLNRNFFNYNLKVYVTKNLLGDRLGDLINLSIYSDRNKDFKYSLGLNISSKHPGLYYESYNSGYSGANWINRITKTKVNNIFLNIKSNLIGNTRLDFRLIDNYTFFSLVSGNNNLIPVVTQNNSTIEYLKIKWQKEFNFGKFTFDNTLVYQKVSQDKDVLNVPEILTRNTIYYSNSILKGAMFFQTGVSIKYFSKYFSNEYNPLVSSFHVQNDKKTGGFPLIDIFVNAKIKQTRLFLKAEHFNSTFTGNNFYSSPSYPYRDFIIRFGLVWNFFN